MNKMSVKIAGLLYRVDPETVTDEFGGFNACCRYLYQIMSISVDPVIQILWDAVRRCDDDNINEKITACIYELSVHM